MVPSKQVDVVGTSGTETKTVSGRRQSARGTGAAGGPAADAAPRTKRVGAAAELTNTCRDTRSSQMVMHTTILTMRALQMKSRCEDLDRAPNSLEYKVYSSVLVGAI